MKIKVYLFYAVTILFFPLFVECALTYGVEDDANKAAMLFGGAQKLVDAHWKENVSGQFDRCVDGLKKIIIEGEEKEEVDDFLYTFKQQRNWFDKTVTGTAKFFDPRYNAVCQKLESLKTLVDAQEKAEKILHRMVLEDKTNPAVFKKIRLVILYDLNAMIQENVEKGIVDQFEFGVIESDLERVVDQAVNLFKKEKYGVEFVIRDETVALERKFAEMKRQLKSQIEENEKLKQDIYSQQKHVEQCKKAQLNAELIAKKARENRKQLVEEAVRKTKEQVEGKLGPELEKERKSKLELEVRNLSIEKEYDYFKQAATSSQEKLEKMTAAQKSVEANARQRVEHANKKALDVQLKAEQKMQYLKNEMNKKEAELQKTDNMLKDKQNQLSQLSKNLQERQAVLQENIQSLEEEKRLLLEKQQDIAKLKTQALQLTKESANVQRQSHVNANRMLTKAQLEADFIRKKALADADEVMQKGSEKVYEQTQKLEKRELEVQFKLQKMLDQAKRDLENTKRKILEAEYVHVSQGKAA